LYVFLISHTCYEPSNLVLLDLITLIMYGEVYKFSSFSLCSLPQPQVQIFSSSDTLNLISSFARDQVSHISKMTGTCKITVLYILIIKRLLNTFCTNDVCQLFLFVLSLKFRQGIYITITGTFDARK
jgi:hypothetical protein